MPQRRGWTIAIWLSLAGVFGLAVSVVRLPDRPASAETTILPSSIAATEPVADRDHGDLRVAAESADSYPVPPELHGVDLSQQTPEHAAAKSWGCVQCHKGSQDPHLKETVQLGCTDCHGGDASTTEYGDAHVFPRKPDAWPSAANPVRSYTLLNRERPEFVRFVNPGDLRVAHLSCGTAGCHAQETLKVRKSMMTHGCMLWGAALYNNGAVPNKWPRFGESYSMHGAPQRLQTVPPPTQEEIATKGVLPFLDPLPRFGVTHPGNILRVFERGGRFRPEVGIPERLEEPGRPRTRLSNRGLGTLNRTDPVFVGLQKTRLLDPTLNFLGTNDHPGDYRSSGCTACHVVYANDRSPVHSGPYAKYGNGGRAAADRDKFVNSVDPIIRTDEPGHPIAHRFTRAIPSSQCIVCHIHPGTTVMNSYLGYMWWDQETDGEFLYPACRDEPSADEYTRRQQSNPNEAAARDNTSDPEFLAHVSELNPKLKHSYFADFHGHGWTFRAVFKKDRDGTLLDHRGREIPNPTSRHRELAVMVPQAVKELYRDRDRQNPDDVKRKLEDLDRIRDGVPVHLLDVHLERGMHCVDCHFEQDVHGDTKLYGEVRAAIEIQCVDCHGTASRRASLRTSGPAAKEQPNGAAGRLLTAARTPFGKPRFEFLGKTIVQNSMVESGLSWEITQVADTIDPRSSHYNALSALAKTVRFDSEGEMVWGDVPSDANACAHADRNMSCVACHSSWNPSCYGCHLPQVANKKLPELHNEGDVSRNYVSYNFQTLRDDVYMLARDGNVTGNRIGPARSSCAIHVGSYNANRESVYVQQQTISAEGLSGIAFSTNVPHTVRGLGETKLCSDCHVSQTENNNALLAQLLMHGTNSLNFIGRYCWIAAGDHGLFAAEVTERDEPQAVIGSTLHRQAFPEQFAEHARNDDELEHVHEHPGHDVSDHVLRPFQQTEVLSVQLRGEYAYAACGPAGLRIFDVAFIDNKAFSERITTAPVSPAGQQLYVRTQYATDVATPTTIAPDPTRTQLAENHESPVHPLYAYLYVADREEGLILVGAGTLLDGNPTNNFVERALTFNPDGVLSGARRITIAGTYAYICSNAGLVVVDLDDPLHPVVTSVLGSDVLSAPNAVQVQFRYAFVCDDDGLKVLDVTDLAHPAPAGRLDLPEAHSVYVARTYAYVAGGSHGLFIVDVTQPRAPRLDQVFNADGQINDLHDVKLGITYVSQFAYLADGHNGLRVVQLTSPDVPGNDGFSPRPQPELIATFALPKHAHALAISKGVDRDRAVDESGHQLAVFGRVGARPLSLSEQRRLYQRPDGTVWTVPDFVRDFGIRDPRARELKLHDDIRRAIPASQDLLGVSQQRK